MPLPFLDLRLLRKPTPRIKLFVWRDIKGRKNFGDELGIIIVAAMLARHGLVLRSSAARPGRLLTIGSCLHAARNGDTVWGSGRNGRVAERAHRFRHLDVRAVRGPITRDFLLARNISVPPIFGDPALLLPHLLDREKKARPTRPLCIIPHMFDPQSVYAQENVVSPLSGWQNCLDAILESEMVLASSLHGVIVAEAYGIPAQYVRFSEKEPLLKYQDYFLGTGRSMPPLLRTVAEALKAGPLPPPKFDAAALMDAFPYDLWASKA